MRRFLFLVVGILWTGGFLAAQRHDNMTEKSVKDTITFATNTKVGNTTGEDGAAVLDKLYLRGSNIEHTFN
jgi:hypothetical protein